MVVGEQCERSAGMVNGGRDVNGSNHATVNTFSPNPSTTNAEIVEQL